MCVRLLCLHKCSLKPIPLASLGEAAKRTHDWRIRICQGPAIKVCICCKVILSMACWERIVLLSQPCPYVRAGDEHSLHVPPDRGQKADVEKVWKVFQYLRPIFTQMSLACDACVLCICKAEKLLSWLGSGQSILFKLHCHLIGNPFQAEAQVWEEARTCWGRRTSAGLRWPSTSPLTFLTPKSGELIYNAVSTIKAAQTPFSKASFAC